MTGTTALKPGREVAVGKRRRAREMAIQMLYQRELGGASLAEVFAAFDVEDHVHESAAAAETEKLGDAVPRPLSEAEQRQVEKAFAYARELTTGVASHAEAIDERIRRHAENWRLERMPVVDRNILRLAIYEMLYESDVPQVVIVDEAIELAKKFGSENSGRFVNGLLDAVLKSEAGRPSSGSTRSGRGAARRTSAGRSC